MNVAPLFSLLYIVGYCDMVKLIISRLRGGCQNYILAKNAVAPYFFCKDTIFSCKPQFQTMQISYSETSTKIFILENQKPEIERFSTCGRPENHKNRHFSM